MKIFIDVGGFIGDSTKAALDPIFGFDKVFCFEPFCEFANEIRKNVKDPRLMVFPCGLYSKSTTKQIYGAGQLGCTIYEDGPHAGLATPIVARFLAASEFLSSATFAEDEIWMKLNCVGAECDILERLLELPEFFKRFKSILVDFDARKIPSQQSRVDGLLLKLSPILCAFQKTSILEW